MCLPMATKLSRIYIIRLPVASKFMQNRMSNDRCYLLTQPTPKSPQTMPLLRI